MSSNWFWVASSVVFTATKRRNAVLHLQDALEIGGADQTDAAQLELGLGEMARFIDSWLINLATVGQRATNATYSAQQANESIHATLMASCSPEFVIVSAADAEKLYLINRLG